MSKAENFSLPVVMCPMEDIQEMVRETRTDKRKLSIPMPSQKKEVPAHTILSIRLLQDCLVEPDVAHRLNPWELGFIASITYKPELSERQRSALKKVALNRLGVDIDANTAASS